MSFSVWMPHGAGTRFDVLLRERLDDSVQLWTGPDAPVPPGHRVLVTGRPTDSELSALRDSLWPTCHVVGLYRSRSGELVREALGGRERVTGALTEDCVVVVCRRRYRIFGGDDVGRFAIS